MNAIEMINGFLDPALNDRSERPRKLQDVLRKWKRYQADNTFMTTKGQFKNTAWVQDSLRDDVYL